jgi:hypothetical protein
MNELVYDPTCPMCHSGDTWESDPTSEGDGILSIENECLQCSCVWYDEYMFTGVSFPDSVGDDPLFV